MEYFRKETVRDNMSYGVRTIAPEMTLGDLLRLFSSSEMSAYPVMHEKRLIGLATKADALKPFAANGVVDNLDSDTIMGTTVEQIMSTGVTKVGLEASLEQAARLIAESNSDSLPVVDGEDFVRGMITRNDIIRALARSTWRSSLPLEIRPVGYAIA